MAQPRGLVIVLILTAVGVLCSGRAQQRHLPQERASFWPPCSVETRTLTWVSTLGRRCRGRSLGGGPASHLALTWRRVPVTAANKPGRPSRSLPLASLLVPSPLHQNSIPSLRPVPNSLHPGNLAPTLPRGGGPLPGGSRTVGFCHMQALLCKKPGSFSAVGPTDTVLANRRWVLYIATQRNI